MTGRDLAALLVYVALVLVAGALLVATADVAPCWPECKP